MSSPDHESSLNELFEEQADRTPDETALFDGSRSITFAELRTHANRVAGNLQALGAPEGCAVGLHLERSIEWVVGILGTLKAGATVMPLPPTYPPERLRAILEHAKLDLVIENAGARLDRSLPGRFIGLEALSEAGPTPRAPGPTQLDQPAFILCSSGSTGTPKMIVRSHRSFLHRLLWTWRNHPYARGEVCCQKAHSTTTHAVYELFEPLLQGSPVVLIPDQEARDLEAFWDTIRTRGISRLLIVPSALQSSLDIPGFMPPTLSVLVLMGEYVSPGLAERAVQVFPATTHLYSIYGSTEASSTLVCNLRESLQPGQELPLGKPIAGDVQALVLGPKRQPVAGGAVGNLHITGPALFSEYLGDPDLTAAAFIDIPGLDKPVYDTHDQVRLLPDGNLQFIGRVDDTVKIRGFRVDLQEVERALQLHPGVRGTAVVVTGEESGNASLLAFVTPAAIDPASVFRTIRRHLPAYMVPSIVVGLDAFPLTNRGKLDRARLLELHVSGSLNQRPNHPASDTERQVAEIWEQTLGRGGFGLENSFFEAGGTSLSVFTLVHRLRIAFALDRTQLPEQSIYRFPTIEAQSARIDALLAGQTQPTVHATPLLVTLRAGNSADQEPFFLVASAGGTLGAYEKLAKALTTSREIVGIRDPFIWGERDPTEGFHRWVARYVNAIRERQPKGPYYVGAYSSAGAFGYEIACQLRRDDQQVALLALIDPLALDRCNRWRFGWWALRATYARMPVMALVRAAGWLRAPIVSLIGTNKPTEKRSDDGLSGESYRQITEAATSNKGHLLALATLLELNTGLPFALSEADFKGIRPEGYLAILTDRVASLTPDVDPTMIERIAIQYSLQVRAQHAYQLGPYDSQILLIEPATRYSGLLHALFRPFAKHILVRAVALGEPSLRNQVLTEKFGALAPHYRSMRDDAFVLGLAKELDQLIS